MSGLIGYLGMIVGAIGIFWGFYYLGEARRPPWEL